MVRRLASMYIDHRYVYLMFKDREHKIEIARIGNYDVKEILKDPLRVDFFDLVIPISQVEEFEFIYTKPDQKNYEFNSKCDSQREISGVHMCKIVVGLEAHKYPISHFC